MNCASEQLSTEELSWRGNFEGLLLGTAVGDALGLPGENLSPARLQRLWKGQWKMRFLFGRGMFSDDTEHTLMVAQALLAHPDDAVAFQRALASKLRWWFAGLPGGVGFATARACLRLWLGFPPHKAAVASAGSGPAMRSAILGAFFACEAPERRAFVQASARLTHQSWQAETAALAVAEAAAVIVANKCKPDTAELFSQLRHLSNESEWQEHLVQIESALQSGISVREFAQRLDLANGVSGYALHVVPVALYAWLHHRGDFRTALAAALDCGGDTDTVGAIVGGLCGAELGTRAIPSEWLGRIAEWPRSVAFIRRLARRLAEQRQSRLPLEPIRYFWPALVARNIVFLAIVFTHGLRRLLPPW